MPFGISGRLGYIAVVPTKTSKKTSLLGQFRRAAAPAAMAVVLLAGGVTASAGPKKDLNDPLLEADGRLRGYNEQTTAMDESSTFLTYGLLVVLSLVSVGVMFKASRRTHLD